MCGSHGAYCVLSSHAGTPAHTNPTRAQGGCMRRRARAAEHSRHWANRYCSRCMVRAVMCERASRLRAQRRVRASTHRLIPFEALLNVLSTCPLRQVENLCASARSLATARASFSGVYYFCRQRARPAVFNWQLCAASDVPPRAHTVARRGRGGGRQQRTLYLRYSAPGSSSMSAGAGLTETNTVTERIEQSRRIFAVAGGVYWRTAASRRRGGHRSFRLLRLYRGIRGVHDVR